MTVFLQLLYNNIGLLFRMVRKPRFFFWGGGGLSQVSFYSYPDKENSSRTKLNSASQLGSKCYRLLKELGTFHLGHETYFS